MTCPACGTINLVGAKFCSECGTRLSSACPSCGATNLPGAKFCNECGTRLVDGAPATAAAVSVGAPIPAPGTRAVGIGGAGAATTTTERRIVSVMFADLVGFTSLAGTRDPEAVRDLLSRYFETAREIVERYGGTIEKFIGDAVMAVWGAPVAQENDAELAVRTALDLIEAVRGLDTGADGRGLEARAGVLTGEAAVNLGAVGQGMVAGDLVNTASRLQSVAPPGVVLVGEATQRAAARAIVFEEAGDQLLKGKPTPVPAWRATRVVAKRGGEGRSEGLEAPFVGRDDELRLLKDFFHATSRERKARLLSVTGHAGIGKSRLAWEFLKYIDGVLEVIWWHEGRSPAFGEGVTFWALGEMVRRRAGLVEGADEATTRAALAATFEEFVPDEAERHWIGPALMTLLGFGDAGGRSRDDLFAAWRTFFERIATEHPVILVFEDLQWADPGLLDFIDHVLEWATNSPIFVVTLARPEIIDRRPDWGAGRRNFVALALEPLPESAMRDLLAGLVRGLPEAALKAILARADGVPLYAVEIVRMLLAEGRLIETDGAYAPKGDLGDLAVPETLHALIAARLDALEPADRALLQDGAVLGQTFPVAALAAIREEDAAAIEPRLRALVRREILILDTDPRSPERGQYGFAQALLRDVAYGTLAKRDRRARHLAAARHFEQLGDDQTAGVLATHYIDAYLASPEGEEADAVAAQARIALRAAADRAVALGSNEQAVAYLERARSVTTDPGEEADLLERIGAAATSAGHFEVGATALRRAVAMREAGDDKAALARAIAALGWSLLSDYKAEAALAILEPAYRALADALPDDPSLVALAAQLGRGYQLHEDRPLAIEWADRALEAAERLYLVPVLAEALITKGGSLAVLGRVWEGVGLARAGIELADQHGLEATSLRGKVMLAGTLAVYDPRAAYEIGAEAFGRARRLGQRHTAAIAAGNAGEAALDLGIFDAPIAMLSEIGAFDLEGADEITVEGVLLEILASTGQPTAERLTKLATLGDPNESVFGSGLSLANVWAGMAEGRFDDVHTHGVRAAELSGINRPYGLLWATRGSIRAGNPERAKETFDALVALNVRGPALDSARLALDAGVRALNGRWAEAASLYHEALNGLRELGMDFHLALACLDIVSVAPPREAFADAAADEARAILSRIGAAPYLGQLDGLLARRASSASAVGETVAAERSATASA